MNLPYQSQALQDRFVANLLNFKRDGFYLDIGSCHAESTNNTYAFEELGWRGICIEVDPQHNESYKKRTCKYINYDATQLDYKVILDNENAPQTIDYLSLDVDAISTDVLKLLPLDVYTFSVITIEHDQYLNGDIYRDEQRDILSKSGYCLICSDVLVPLQEDTKENCSFEDWWIHKSTSLPDHNGINSHRSYPNEIIAKFK